MDSVYIHYLVHSRPYVKLYSGRAAELIFVEMDGVEMTGTRCWTE